jgi:hypothetical protein
MDENHCQDGTLINNIIILKKIKEAEATEDFSIITTIHDDISKIFNKKLKLSQLSKKSQLSQSSQSSKKSQLSQSSKRPRRGGKKTI